MEGKKIAFIVVAIATVGGIGYYLYKKNKEVVTLKSSSVSLPEAKAKASSQATTKIKALALKTVKMDRDKYNEARISASKNYTKASNIYE